MRVLVITDSIPYPPVSGDRIRTYHLLRRIAREHEVWLAALIKRPEELEGVAHMREFCHGVETAKPRRGQPITYLPDWLRYGLAGKPPELMFEHSDELAQKIQRFAFATAFDIIHIEPSPMGLYLEAIPPGTQRARTVLTFHNMTADQYARLFQVERRPVVKLRAWLHSRAMRRWEPRYAGRFDRSVTVSEEDRRLLLKANPRLQVEVIPNGVDAQAYQPLPPDVTSPNLLFIGKMSSLANTDAALYFCREILPLVRRVIPDIELWIVGRDPGPEVRQLEGDGVHVTGTVEEVLPYYRQSAVCVVPLRAGGGTRLKILEAMALGRPVVSTSIGCEGLEVTDGEHLFIADSPELFAEQTVRLLNDGALYRRITANARQLVLTRYDWDIIAGQLMQLYAQMACSERPL